jgi:hypothetical protein
MFNSASGTKVSISNAVIASTVDDAAEFGALTFIEIGEVESIDRIGDVSSGVTFASLKDARGRTKKGTRSAGNTVITCAYDPFDAGQIAVRAAEATKFEYAFKVELADKQDENDTNSIFYLRALVMSADAPIGGNDGIVRQTFTLGVNAKPLEVPATVVP